ncbi:hypothetical protein KIN20_016846 [Parelaphostrongylus tenuis]|uniref:Uncharacterized protein n=1 Tax=Parelaphostrongylus tenuis TaxID=148309 RepID=A0AAD5N5T2_PARTN|nr:hypothetical protein KIN20_016846 [Parelaphostrongylus tenuis]
MEEKISTRIIFYIAFAFRANYLATFPRRIVVVVIPPVAVATTTTTTSIRLDSSVRRRYSMAIVVVLAMMNSGCDLNQPASTVICPRPANDTPACFSTTLIAIVCVDLRALR